MSGVRHSGITFALCAAAAAIGISQLQQNSASATAARWSLAPSVARIGAPAVQFTEVKQVVPVGEDSILVIDSKTLSLLLFDSRGKEVRRVGAAGQGPGEFRFLSRGGFLGDSVWGTDGTKIHFFKLNGTYASTRPQMRASLRSGTKTSFFQAEGILRSGSLPAFVGVLNAPPARGVAPSHGQVGVLGLHLGDSVAVDTLTWLALAPKAFMMEVGPYIHFPGPNHFADTPLWRVSDNGLGVAVVERRIPRTGAGATYRVRKWNERGDSVFSVNIPFAPVALPRALLDTVIDRFTDDLADNYPSRAVARKLVADSMGTPPNYPPVSDIVFGNDGRIWIGRESLIPPPFRITRYDVIGVDGKLQGFVTLNRPGRLMAATATAIWVVENDADDVPALFKYPVRR